MALVVQRTFFELCDATQFQGRPRIYTDSELLTKRCWEDDLPTTHCCKDCDKFTESTESVSGSTSGAMSDSGFDTEEEGSDDLSTPVMVVQSSPVIPSAPSPSPSLPVQAMPAMNWALPMAFQMPVMFVVPAAAVGAPVLPTHERMNNHDRQQSSSSKTGPVKNRKRVTASTRLGAHVDETHNETGRTTVMLRHLPRALSRDMLLAVFDQEGFSGMYDFVYMPLDFVRPASLGYAFVNLVSSEAAMAFWAAFDGFSRWPISCDKVCCVSWSSPHQGLEEHVNRYKNSPLLHESVPDQCRPVLLEKGVRIAFPPPTKPLRAPRLRAARHRHSFWDPKARSIDMVMEDEI